MNNKERIETTVSAFPTKAFFVGMLTRDIELQDAILDLLDNCIDGVVRTLKEKVSLDGTEDTQPYKGFWAKIDFDEKTFKIADNCGGISRKLLENYAFRLGRTDIERDKDLPTVGIYGIGMKRAIFKMGRSCTVTTRHGKEASRVTISENWLEDDEAWRLPLVELTPKAVKEEGTIIEILKLYEPIARLFNFKKNAVFLDDFKETVSSHYSYIIHKGFRITVNGTPITEKHFAVQFTPFEKVHKDKSIAPFVYEGTVKDVFVSLIMGLYRELPSEEELETDLQTTGGSKENAGWTIICNDRVVVYCDKTRLTGWGEAGVPSYHSQFIAISGVVHFRSDNAWKLPVTTTKRGIDANSETYAIVKDIMREALKTFTSHTNRWKSPTEERKEITRKTEAVEMSEVINLIPENAWLKVRNRPYEGRKFVPKLPTPAETNPYKTIKFMRPLEEIRIVSEYVLGDPGMPPTDVGQKCFEDVLAKVKK